MNYEVFAYWNGQDMYNALNFVAAIMGGDDYLGLMKAMALVGLLCATTYALLTVRGQTIGTYFMGFVFVYGVIFVPKSTVIVNDLRAASTYTVANVPLGLAVMYSTISRIGNFLTQQYEANFTPLDDERFSKSGMVFGARVLETMAVQSFPDPAVKSDVMTFYRDCVAPELIEDGSKSNTLKNSKDLATDIQRIVNPGRGTVMSALKSNGSDAMSCSDVIPALNLYINQQNSIQASLGKVGRVVRADQGTQLSNAVLVQTTESDVSNMLNNLMSISDSAQQALSQSMWINGIHDADMALRNGYGNTQSTSYATAVTEQSNRQAAYTGKMWAEKALPLIRNIAEFVLISAFPLVFIIMLVAGENALKVIKLYLTVLGSLALWAPFTAILNSLVISNGRQAIMAMTASGGGITLDNINGLIDLALQQQSLAGQLFLAVPMVAFALVSGGAQAATAAVGGLTSSATGAAGQVSGQLAQGNASGGQVGWRNTNAFNTTTGQSNTAMTSRSGFTQMESGAGVTVLGGGAPGGGTFNGRTSQLGSWSASLDSAVESGFIKKVDSSMSASRSSIASALETVRTAQASGFRSENASKAEKAFTAALTTTDAKERARLAAEGASYANAAAMESSTGKNSREAVQAKGGLGVNMGPISLGGSLDVTNDRTQSTGAKVGTSAQTVGNFSNQDSTREGTTDEKKLSSSSANSSSNSNFVQSQMEKAKQFGLQGQAQAQEALQAGEQLSAARTDRGGIKTDLSNQVVSMLGGASAAQQLYAADQNRFGTAVTQAAESLIAARSLGPGNSQHFDGVSGNAPVTTGVINAEQQKVNDKVKPQISGAPTAANAMPTGQPTNGAPATGGRPATAGGAGQPPGQGSSPLGQGNRTTNPFAAPSTPKPASVPSMPTDVANPSGSGTVSADQVAQTAQNRSKNISTAVSDTQTDVMRHVGRTTEESNSRNKQ